LSSSEASGFGYQTKIGERPASRYVGSVTWSGLKEAAMSENRPAADRLGSSPGCERAIKAQVRPWLAPESLRQAKR
jgi:hypothetical protein